MSHQKHKNIMRLKKGVQKKLDDITEQIDSLTSTLEEYGNEAKSVGDELLSCKDDSEFMQKYLDVMQVLGRYYDTTLLLGAQIWDVLDNTSFADKCDASETNSINIKVEPNEDCCEEPEEKAKTLCLIKNENKVSEENIKAASLKCDSENKHVETDPTNIKAEQDEDCYKEFEDKTSVLCLTKNADKVSEENIKTALRFDSENMHVETNIKAELDEDCYKELGDKTSTLCLTTNGNKVSEENIKTASLRFDSEKMHIETNSTNTNVELDEDCYKELEDKTSALCLTENGNKASGEKIEATRLEFDPKNLNVKTDSTHEASDEKSNKEETVKPDMRPARTDEIVRNNSIESTTGLQSDKESVDIAVLDANGNNSLQGSLSEKNVADLVDESMPSTKEMAVSKWLDSNEKSKHDLVGTDSSKEMANNNNNNKVQSSSESNVSLGDSHDCQSPEQLHLEMKLSEEEDMCKDITKTLSKSGILEIPDAILNVGIQLGTSLLFTNKDTVIPQVAFPTGTTFPTVVSEISTPWCFYLQPYGPDLKQLREKIQFCVSHLEDSVAYINKPIGGEYCLAMFPRDGMFYRAKIISVVYKSRIGAVLDFDATVLFIDYGNRDQVNRSFLRKLPQQLAFLPAQAVCCALSKVSPVNYTLLWPDIVIKYFQDFVASKQLSCQVVFSCTEAASFPVIVELTAFFPSQQYVMAQPHTIVVPQVHFQPVSISAALVQQGLARLCSLADQVNNIRKINDNFLSTINPDNFPSPLNPDNSPVSKHLALTYPGMYPCPSSPNPVSYNTISNSVIELSPTCSNSDKSSDLPKLATSPPLPQRSDKISDVTSSKSDIEPKTLKAFKMRTHQETSSTLKSFSSLESGPSLSDQKKSVSHVNNQPKDQKKSVSHVNNQPKDQKKSVSHVNNQKDEINPIPRLPKCKQNSHNLTVSDVSHENKDYSETSLSAQVNEEQTGLSRKIDHGPRLSQKSQDKHSSPSQKAKNAQTSTQPEKIGDSHSSQSQDAHSSLKSQGTGNMHTSCPNKGAENVISSGQKATEKKSRKKLKAGTSTKPSDLLHESQNKESGPIKHGEGHEMNEEKMITAGHSNHVREKPTSSFEANSETEELCIDDSSSVGVMVATIESPSSFRVHVINISVAKYLDRLRRELHRVITSKSKAELKKWNQDFKLEAGTCCCSQFQTDKDYYRGLILDVKQSVNAANEPKQVLVYYVDYGDKEWVPGNKIYPLLSEFMDIPCLAVPCSLAYIMPAKRCRRSKTNAGQIWQADAIKEFRKLSCSEKRLTMHILTGDYTELQQRKITDALCPEKLEVVLMDIGGPDEICINFDLIRLGWAELTSSIDDPKNVLQTQDMKADAENLIDWDPMAEDYQSSRNSYKVDIDDAGVATVGYINSIPLITTGVQAGVYLVHNYFISKGAKDERRVCKYYGSGRECYRGDKCPYQHIELTSGITQDQRAVYAYDNQDVDTFLPSLGDCVAVDVSTVLNPGHFYVVMPWGKKTIQNMNKIRTEDGFDEDEEDVEMLEELVQAMNDHYQKSSKFRDRDMILPAEGEIVAAQFSADKLWYRARVVRTSEKKVEVFYVDFGNRDWVNENDIKTLEKQFLHLPFQSVECFLSGVEPTEKNTWSSASKEFMRNMVNGKTLVAIVKAKSSSSLYIDLYDTSGQEDTNIASALIAAGHAQMPSCDSSSGVISQASSTGSINMIPG